MLAIGLALGAAACWGVADFLGGLVSRRIAVPWVLLLVEGGGLVLIAVIALASGEPFFTDAQDALLAAAAGCSGVLALGCFYRALAIGTMSIVAPISATGVTLPVVVGLATGDTPSSVVLAGLMLTAAGVVVASREHHHDEEAARAGRAAIVLALAAAVGFGSFFVLSDPPSDASVVWTLVVVRAAATPLVAAIVLVRRSRPPARADVPTVLLIGVIDLSATALVGLANTEGDLEIVSVLGSMYPIATVILAALVLGERLARPQAAGVVAALLGVALVAAG